MSTIIDGYNLLHVVGIISRGVGPGSLRRGRLALLNFLAESLQPEEAPHTTVVFDAHDPPPGSPRTLEHRGLRVLFSSQYDDADSQIEELIRRDSAPRHLTVVSSDHRVQRAARRRKAKAVDSDQWYAEICRRRQQRRESAADAQARVYVPLLEEDVNYWIRQFGGESLLAELIEEESAEEPPADELPADQLSEEETADDKPAPEEVENPFPAGYAEDLLEEDLLEEDHESDDPDNPFPPGYGQDIEEE